MNKKNDIGELGDVPNEQYKKFFDKFSQIETLEVKDWKPTHILAFFCKKYKETYNIDYQFKFNSPSPSKCFEVFQVKKLAMLLTSNPVLLKEYIEWIYDNKVSKAKRRLTSISFMTGEDVIKEYKFNVLLSKNNTSIDRSTLLPEKYQLAFQENNIQIKTYGDLSFISQLPDKPEHILSAFSKIEELGFDLSLLKTIV